MRLEERIIVVLDLLKAEYPDHEGTSLKYEDPLQLLVATILSAQSTDETVNKITPDLFGRYKTAEDFAYAEREEIEELIFSAGYYRNKAEWIQKTCKKLVEDHDSQIPEDMDELVELKGVGRKTANIVLSEVYGLEQGIAIDTHVKRLTSRLEFSNEEKQDEIERDLMNLVPEGRWYEYSNLLISHGRNVCEAREPRCEDCVISIFCPSSFSFG